MGPVAVVVLRAAGDTVASWPLVVQGVDLGVVDVVARLELGARRMGWRLSLRDAAPALRDLLRLVGLDEVLEVVG